MSTSYYTGPESPELRAASETLERFNSIFLMRPQIHDTSSWDDMLWRVYLLAVHQVLTHAPAPSDDFIVLVAACAAQQQFSDLWRARCLWLYVFENHTPRTQAERERLFEAAASLRRGCLSLTSGMHNHLLQNPTNIAPDALVRILMSDEVHGVQP